MSPALIGALRSLLSVIVFAIVSWLATAANLQGVLPAAIGTIVSMLALSFEHYMAANGTTALFGLVSQK